MNDKKHSQVMCKRQWWQQKRWQTPTIFGLTNSLPQLWTHLSKVHSQTASPFSYSCLAFSEHTQQSKHERRTRFVLLLHLEKGEEGLNNIVWEKYKWMVREAFLCSLATIYFMESKQLSAILLSKITHRKGEGKQSNIEI